MRRRLRLFSQAVSTPRREALEGSTLLTMKTSSRRPAMASATTRLGAAAGIHLRRVDQRHAEIDAELQRRDLIGVAALVLAHLPGALAERRHAVARGKFDGSEVGHDCNLRIGASDLGRDSSSSSEWRVRCRATRKNPPDRSGGFCIEAFAAVAAKAYFSRFFSAAPRMSPSEAPESVEPYWATASFSSAISSALIDTCSLRVFLS